MDLSVESLAHLQHVTTNDNHVHVSEGKGESTSRDRYSVRQLSCRSEGLSRGGRVGGVARGNGGGNREGEGSINEWSE